MSTLPSVSEELWQTFSSGLDRFIRSRVADPDAVEDLRQEILLKIQRKSEAPEKVRNTEAWIYRIARNAIVDYYRTRKPVLELPEELSGVLLEKDASSESLKNTFREMIERLPEPYREAIRLTAFEGLSQRALAQRLGLSFSGAKSRVQRGRALLRKNLEACCRFEFDRRGGFLACTPRKSQGCEPCE